jgi:hypothetical protein
MSKRTRVFLFAAAGVLTAVLATGLVAWSMGVPLLAALGGNEPAELAYVPWNARMVAYVDVRDVMSSPLHDRFRQFENGAQSSPDSLEARTGINFQTDIDRVVMSSVDLGGVRNMASLLIARGRFDQVRIEGVMREHGGEASEYRGARMVVVKSEPHDAALAFAEPGLILFGTSESVHGALDAKAGAAAGIRANGDFMKQVGDVEDGAAWSVAKFDSLAGAGGLPPAVASQLPPINWLAASGRLDAGLHGLVRAEANDEQAAQNLRDVVKGFLALMKMQGARQPEYKGVFDSVALTSEGKSVSLSFEVTPQMLDLLSSGAGMRRPAVPRGPANPQTPQRF